MRKPTSVDTLTALGRVRLSPSFFMRDFLFSEVATIDGIANIPDDPAMAIQTGTQLCEQLLEPLQSVFGRLAIRSAYRSSELNGFANAQQRAGRKGYNCAANEANFAGHIWDRRDDEGRIGATACIVVPAFVDAFPEEGDWTKLAWWIHDTLPYSTLEFFPTLFAFNIGWHDRSKREISSFAVPRGWLTRPGMDNHEVCHRSEWAALAQAFPI